MNKISSLILQPTVIGIGASIFLLAYNQKLRPIDYFVHIPFWIAVVRPSGVYWHTKFLKDINKGIFPTQMKVYRQMYLSSKNAILYDIVLNHVVYHSALTSLLLVYMYFANNLLKGTKFDQRKDTIAENKKQTNQLIQIFKLSAVNLIQGRVLISCASILSEYWITYFSLKSQGSKEVYSLHPITKRFLLAKQMLLNWSWSGLILKQFYKSYWQGNETIEKVKQQSI